MQENNEDVVEVVNDNLTEELNDATSEATIDGQPSTDPVEEITELTEEQKREVFIYQLKQSKIKFHPIKSKVNVVKTTEVVHPFGGTYSRTRQLKINQTESNVTVNQFDKAYRKIRKAKNKAVKASRKANR